MQNDVCDIITEVQSLGIRVPAQITGRTSGAGPAEGRAFIINNVAVNAPIIAPYVTKSPYSLKEYIYPLTENSKKFILLKNGKEILPVEVVPEPAFYKLQTSDGLDFRKVALLHGKDCLASTVIQTCVNWKNGAACQFCGTEVSLSNGNTIARKTPGQLAEAAKTAHIIDGVSHVVLTSGTAPYSSEILYLAECARAVKSAAGIPVHVQFVPPIDLNLLDELKNADVDTVGIHIESFDVETLARVAPAKAAIGIERYEAAWKKAVELFGPGQVSSFLIVGLGEPLESVIWGSEILADIGVYPFVVPLRPIPGSRMQDAIPPDPQIMKEIYTSVASILSKKGLSARKNRAGCVRCGACSALGVYEEECDRLICHTARTRRELDQAMAIRHEVFVKEQGIFKDSDADEHDESSIHLVLESDGNIIGCVRAYPNGSATQWIGGRLAVLKEHRAFRAGRMLVKEAMKRVKKKGCTVFTAHVQEKNIAFFKKIGWNPIGTLENYMGYPHQLMQADLSKVSSDIPAI